MMKKKNALAMQISRLNLLRLHFVMSFMGQRMFARIIHIEKTNARTFFTAGINPFQRREKYVYTEVLFIPAVINYFWKLLCSVFSAEKNTRLARYYYITEEAFFSFSSSHCMHLPPSKVIVGEV